MLRGMDRWLGPSLASKTYPERSVSRVFLAVANHFEPFHKADKPEAIKRMKRWQDEFPVVIADFSDAGGRKPRHTFCYPVEQYDGEVLSRLADLCQATGSETEVHLHHSDDTAASLREKLGRGLEGLMKHGLLSRAAGGQPRFCFVHGDWALANSHPQGKHCGVPEEIGILRELGCVADFTFPSAPSATQPRRVNAIYYTPNTGSPATLARGAAVEAGKVPGSRDSLDHLLLVQGVATLNWGKRKFGLLPGLENSDITLMNPPTPARWNLWLRKAPRVAGRPDWAFVKLHTHGAPTWNADMHLGKPMRLFREYLASQAVPYHFVTTREMVNVIHALEDGAKDFTPSMLDHRYAPPG